MKKHTWSNAEQSRDYEPAPGADNVFETSEPTTQLVSDVDVVKIEPEKKSKAVDDSTPAEYYPKPTTGGAVVKARYVTRIRNSDLVFVNESNKADVRLVPFAVEMYRGGVVEFSENEWRAFKDASNNDFVVDALKWFK